MLRICAPEKIDASLHVQSHTLLGKVAENKSVRYAGEASEY
jgi:hypothetical protein